VALALKGVKKNKKPTEERRKEGQKEATPHKPKIKGKS